MLQSLYTGHNTLNIFLSFFPPYSLFSIIIDWHMQFVSCLQCMENIINKCKADHFQVCHIAQVKEAICDKVCRLL